MLTFKQFLTEMQVNLSKEGTALSSRVIDPRTGEIDNRSRRHLMKEVLPSNIDIDRAVSTLTAPGHQRVNMVPTHTHIVKGTTQHVAVFGLTTGEVKGQTHYHAYFRPVTDDGQVDMSAPEQKIQLSKLSKTKGVKNTLRAEDEMIKNLNARLDNVKKEHGITHVPIVVNNRTYHVHRFVSTPGTPKSDVYSVRGMTYDPNTELHLSLKAGKHPKDVQQWGGISHIKKRNHPEVRAFVKDVYHASLGKLDRGQRFYRTIKDPHLKSMMVFGHDYGSPKFGINNVQAFVQGNINVVPHPTLPGHWTLEASHIIYNGQSIEGKYKPVLVARYQSDRHTSIPNAAQLGINSVGETGSATLAYSRIGAFPSGGIPRNTKPI